MSSPLVHVVLTGSESVGKTTLAAELAEHYGALVVPEFVRGFAEAKRAPLDVADLGPIASGQMQAADELAARAVARGDRVLLHDTDLVSTVVYAHHYFGRCPQHIEDAAIARRPALYILQDIDVPWIADGVRDRGDRREEIQQLFVDTLVRLESRYLTIRGDWHTRRASAVRAIDPLLSL